MSHKIAYVMSRFPHLPETFILREMSELERQGWTVSLYPLLLQQQPVIHEEARAWLSRARHIPFISPPVLAANSSQLARAPYQYGQLWSRVLRENITSLTLLSRAMAIFPKAIYAARMMQQEGITHIHAHYATHPALFAWLIHQLTGLSYSVTVHAHDIFVHSEMLATKLRAATFVVASSDYSRDYLARELGPWVRDKTWVIHSGITPGHYQTRLAGRERLEIISVGNLQHYKGHRYLVEACAHLRDQSIPFRCRIIGEGTEQATLERIIASQQLKGQVELMGAKPQEEVAQLLATAHCYVQPSIITTTGRMEGIPVSLMEALACGLPVVASHLSGIPELIRPGETGYLVPPGNALALAEILAEIYMNPGQARQLAQAGRELVLKEFNLQQNVSHLAALFKQMIAPLPSELDRPQG